MAGLHGGIVRTPVHRELMELHKVKRAAIVAVYEASLRFGETGRYEITYRALSELRSALIDSDSSLDFDDPKERP